MVIELVISRSDETTKTCRISQVEVITAHQGEWQPQEVRSNLSV